MALHVFDRGRIEQWVSVHNYAITMEFFLEKGQVGWSVAVEANEWRFRTVLWYRSNVLLFSHPKLRDIATIHQFMDKAKVLRPDALVILVDDVKDIPPQLDAEIDLLLSTRGLS